MYRLLLLSCLSVFIIQLYAQQPLAELAVVEEEGRWIEIHVDVHTSPQAFLSSYKDDMGLSARDGFQSIENKTDKLGYNHHKFNQQFKNIPVEGAQFIVHTEDSRIIRSNGRLVKNINPTMDVLIDAEEAINSAILYTDAPAYYWECAQKEALIKRIKKDQNATFYPEAELVYAEKNYSQDGSKYRLAWKMDIHAEGPKGKKTIFVDARDGHILFENEGCQEASVEAHGNTRYHGEQTFITDSVASDQYRLRDYSRLAAIETYDMNTFSADTIEAAIDFTDDDNFWDNANDKFDDAAVDVHWGMQQTFDYYYNVHDRLSYDDQGSPIISYVHVGVNWFNARWTGTWAEFGDGSDNPLTSIDVVSHELTHGVTRHTAGLVYRNESGALNESFSDIFGNAVELYAIPDSFSWDVGIGNFQFRSMSNPNGFNDPDTYFGNHWFTEDADNGGVHTNSSVQNYWFYLLSEGGTGINDLGNSYDMTGLGIDTAAAIAYRNLSTYLTTSSTYFDARYGAILSAEDLYGPCSNAVLQTIHAWYAVGVGPDMIIRDMEVHEPSAPVTSSCAFSDEEAITLNLLYRRSGCQNGIPAGTRIPIGYTLNDGDPVMDTLILAEDLIDGDELQYTFVSPIDLSNPAYYDFDFFATFDGDQNPNNDQLPTFTVVSVNTLDDNFLIHFNEFSRPAVPPYYIIKDVHSEAMTSRDASSSGLRGFLFSGNEGQRNNIDYTTDEAKIFINNPEYESQLCMCIDASNWDSLSIAFDLRQGYSELHADREPDLVNPNLVVALRLIADDVPVSPQFHPDTAFADTFVRQVINLDHLVGTSFNLCFQGKHIYSKADDNMDTEGDYSHIDNVELIMSEMNVGTSIPNLDPTTVSVFPNPTADRLTVQWNDKGLIPQSIQMINLQGQVIDQAKTTGMTSWTLDVSGQAAGIYFIEIQTAEGRVVKKILVE